MIRLLASSVNLFIFNIWYQNGEEMKIFKSSLLMLTVVLALSTEALATESSSGWFVGTGVTFGEYDDDGFDTSVVVPELHGGYQFGDYLKLIVGVNTFSASRNANTDKEKITTLYATIRPQWKFDSGFLAYVEAGVTDTEDLSGLIGKLGLGLGYDEGQHEVSAGLNFFTVGSKREGNVGGLILQYTYHF